MEHKKIRASIVSGISMLAVILLTIISMFLQDRTERWITHANEVKFYILEIYDLLQSAESNQRGYLLTGDRIYLEPISTYKDYIAEVFDLLREKTSDNSEQMVNVNHYEFLSKLKMAELDSNLVLFKNGIGEPTLIEVKTNSGERLMKTIDKHRRKMLAEEDERLVTRKKNNDLLGFFTMLFLIVAASTAGFSLYALYKQISPLISDLKIANGELNKVVELKDREIEVRKRLEQRNRSLIDKLTAKNEELNHFAYIASHDLQEPLRTVNNFIEVFEEEYGEKLDDDAQEYFDFITGATTRMKALIEGLLSFSRLGQSGEFKKVDLETTLPEVLENIAAAIEEKDAVIEIGPMPTVNCLPIEIPQLFQNLIVNAMKFTKAGETPLVKISAEDKGEHWLFCVKDNGIGIDRFNQKKIFNMFSRLHLHEDYQGQGLGLAFCKKITELHEGDIWVESAPGKGSSFFFTISKNLKNEEA